MTLQVDEVPCRRALDELGVQLGAGRGEGDVHAAAGIRPGGGAIEIAVVQRVVEQLRLFDVHLLDGLDTALLLQPLHAQSGDVDGVGGRGIQHAALLVHDLPVHDLGGGGHGPAQQVAADDHDGQARGTYVLLGTGVDHAEAADIVDLAQDVGRHVRHQRDLAGLGQGRIAGAVDGVVGGDVEIIRVGIELRGVQRGNVGVLVVLGGRHHVHLAVLPGLHQRAVGKIAAVHVVSRAAAGHKIHRDGRELARRAALQKQHRVVLGNVHQLAQGRLGLIEDGLILLGSVTHLHDVHAGVAIAQHFPRRLLQYLLGHGGRTGGKIVNALHDHTVLSGGLLSARCRSLFTLYYSASLLGMGKMTVNKYR